MSFNVLMALFGQPVPDPRALRPEDVACRSCHARRGQPCGGRMTPGHFHADRIDRWNRDKTHARNSVFWSLDKELKTLGRNGGMFDSVWEKYHREDFAGAVAEVATLRDVL